MIAKTVFGLERVLAGELEALGASEVRTGRRMVSFEGDQRLLYRANFWCRTAIRVLKPIHTFAADNEAALYAGVQAIDWSEHLDVHGSLAIDPVVFSSFCTHSLYAAQLAKDAIVDQFRERVGERPSVDKDDPDLRINLHLNQNVATVYLDASGDSLHKRGYRRAAGEAPLNEVLAAGILQLSGWDRRSPLADFMCGSGTLPIEAAQLARNLAPGLTRKLFGYQLWHDYDDVLHAEVVAEAKAAALPALDFPIVGSDLDSQIIEIARVNARAAGVSKDLRFTVDSYDVARPPAAEGTLIFNPPYDERMRLDKIEAVYRRIGAVMKSRWPGYTAFVFTGNLDAATQMGLKTSFRLQMFNGPIECRLIKVELFRKKDKQSGKEEHGQVHPPINTETAAARQHESNEPDDRDSSCEPRPRSATASGLASPTSSLAPATPKQFVAPKAADLPRLRGWRDQAEVFRNRLTRMAKHWAKWARRQGITCYRVYDRDVPEVPLTIDIYEGHLHVAEYDRPHDRTEIEHQQWLEHMIDTAAAALAIERTCVFLKRRERQRGEAQYERQGNEGKSLIVGEAGLRFEVNLSDYLDTGLFLDHRITRTMVGREAAGKRVLNLFAYTGAFTVHAAAGGAASTVTVDLSKTYLDWAQRNVRLNKLLDPRHEFIRDDALDYLRSLERNSRPFDLAVVDPPTFSNSKRTEDIFDVQRDHVELLRLVLGHLAPGGKIYFSTNFRRFKFAQEELAGCKIREISKQTVPPDFRNKRIHRCWTLMHADGPRPEPARLAD